MKNYRFFTNYTDLKLKIVYFSIICCFFALFIFSNHSLADDISTQIHSPQVFEYTPGVTDLNYNSNGYGKEFLPSGQIAYYDTVYFGAYPQTEITSTNSPDVYQLLLSRDEWQDNIITINNKKYLRITRADATNKGNLASDYVGIEHTSDYYLWDDDTSYHYFEFRPIKWRVLSVKNGVAFLLADKALDDKQFSVTFEDTTWSNSDLRSWLNGYLPSETHSGIDYSLNNFINTAFSSEEQNIIFITEVENLKNDKWGTSGGPNTCDRIYLPSIYDMYGASAISYGFSKILGCYDEARRSKITDYAYAMGCWKCRFNQFKGNCAWWLRSPGSTTLGVSNIARDGYVHKNYPDDIIYNNRGVRPCIQINLKAENINNYVSFAGRIDSITEAIGDVSSVTGTVGDILCDGISNDLSETDSSTTYTGSSGKTSQETVLNSNYTEKYEKESTAPSVNLKSNKKYFLYYEVTATDDSGLQYIKINSKKIKLKGVQKYMFKLSKYTKKLKVISDVRRLLKSKEKYKKKNSKKLEKIVLEKSKNKIVLTDIYGNKTKLKFYVK